MSEEGLCGKCRESYKQWVALNKWADEVILKYLDEENKGKIEEKSKWGIILLPGEEIYDLGKSYSWDKVDKGKNCFTATHQVEILIGSLKRVVETPWGDDSKLDYLIKNTLREMRKLFMSPICSQCGREL